MTKKWKRATRSELTQELQELITVADDWRREAKKLDEELNKAKIMYLNSLAVINYLEKKVDRLSEEKE